MSRTAWRATSTSRSLVIEAGPRTSPAMTIRLVVASVSTPQRACGSAARKVSTIASEIRSQTLSGCPSDTDSLVKTKSCFGNGNSPLISAFNRIPGAIRPALVETSPVSGVTLSNANAAASRGILSAAASRGAGRVLFEGPSALGGQRLGEVEQAAPHPGIIDREIRLDEFHGLAL